MRPSVKSVQSVAYPKCVLNSGSGARGRGLQSPRPDLDVHDFKTGFEALDRVTAGSRPEFMGHETGITKIGDRVRNKTIVHFLGVVDLGAAGHAGHVDVADL